MQMRVSQISASRLHEGRTNKEHMNLKKWTAPLHYNHRCSENCTCQSMGRGSFTLGQLGILLAAIFPKSSRNEFPALVMAFTHCIHAFLQTATCRVKFAAPFCSSMFRMILNFPKPMV